MNEHRLPSHYLSHPIEMHVIGAGGNGSQLVNGLARLHLALRAAGHPFGLKVTLYDPDTITEANVGRQLFSPADVGQSKAAVLIHRLNLYFQLSWRAESTRFTWREQDVEDAFYVGCVDTAAARRDLHRFFAKTHYRPDSYWLDLGNEANTGQVVLGSGFSKANALDETINQYKRLPFVTELFPELMDEKVPENNTPSCSLADALGKQDLFINQFVATNALQLLWTFFRQGRLKHHGSFINLEANTVRPLPIDEKLWLRMGYGTKPKKVKKGTVAKTRVKSK